MDAPAPRSAERLLLRALETLGQGVMFVGAHPDDETFALGGHLPRLPRAEVVIVTDGAPRDLRDALTVGFATAETYSAARSAELRAALKVAGVPAGQLTELQVPDQQAIFALPQLSHRLAELSGARGSWLMVTHAYEGGHPDHDAVALAVHAAQQLLAAAGETPPVILEMPYYRLGPGGVVQGFERGEGVYLAELDDRQLETKTEMMNRHASQLQLFRQASARFRTRHESFRVAPCHDFRVPPNGGHLLYERWGLNVTGAQWQEQAARALKNLGIGP